MSTQAGYQSWGLYPRVVQKPLIWIDRAKPLPRPESADESLLCYGLGRSYGDSCLNAEGAIIPTQYLNHFLAFDPAAGVVRCEAGVSFADILKLIVQKGWFLPVTPGTKFITVGGAIANDIHGKNHHVDGNFGHHVLRFELLRSDGSRTVCSKEENSGLFYATIGGMGLTGAITWAEFRLKRINNPFIAQEIVRFSNLREFFQLSAESEADYDYTVSWVDCLATGESLGRGHFIRGNHAPQCMENPKAWSPPKQLAVPFNFPSFALNPLSVKAFNLLYYNKQQARCKAGIIPFDPFFYPLDAIHHWNRIYGTRGFLQWQCVVPFDQGEDSIREIFKQITHSRLGSFLAVLKTFGAVPAVGMLSFPRQGVTLALDFPNVGDKLFKLMDELDRVVSASGGAIYPAKDARMSPELFRQAYPRVEEFKQYKDPKFSSTFWQRVMENK